jgi:hypothetical protein
MTKMDGGSVPQPRWSAGGIRRLCARLGKSITRNGTSVAHDAATTDLTPAEASYIELASQSAYMKRTLAELEEAFQTGTAPAH